VAGGIAAIDRYAGVLNGAVIGGSGHPAGFIVGDEHGQIAVKAEDDIVQMIEPFRVIDLKLREEDVIARINISYFRRPDNTIWGELERDKESNKKKFSPTFKLKI